MFAHGGVALVTSPHHANIIQSYALDADDGAEPPPFKVEDMQGKGVGLRANRSIAKGEVLMVRAPSLVVQTEAIAKLEVGVRDRSKEPSVPISRHPPPFRHFPSPVPYSYGPFPSPDCKVNLMSAGVRLSV